MCRGKWMTARSKRMIFGRRGWNINQTHDVLWAVMVYLRTLPQWDPQALLIANDQTSVMMAHNV